MGPTTGPLLKATDFSFFALPFLPLIAPARFFDFSVGIVDREGGVLLPKKDANIHEAVNLARASGHNPLESMHMSGRKLIKLTTLLGH